jgi:hypothetical protein
MTDGKRECIFWQRVLQKCTGVERQRKRRLKRLFKSWMPITFVKGNYFGTPLCTTCKSNEAGDNKCTYMYTVVVRTYIQCRGLCM